MIDDLVDSVLYYQQEGLLRKEIAAMGSSYGGLAALLLALRSEVKVAAAVASYAPLDPATLVTAALSREAAWAEEYITRVGDPRDAGDALWSASAAKRVDEFRCAVLLAEGENDVRIGPSLGAAFVSRLEERHLPVMHLSFYDEGHQIQRDKNRFVLPTDLHRGQVAVQVDPVQTAKIKPDMTIEQVVHRHASRRHRAPPPTNPAVVHQRRPGPGRTSPHTDNHRTGRSEAEPH